MRSYTVGSRPAAELLGAVAVSTEAAYRSAIDRLPPPMQRIASYHAGLLHSEGRATRSARKRVRPALALCSARAAGADPVTALPAAVAVELTHDFSLLHDDIMDRDTLRRGRPSAWCVFGTGPVILAGDMLLALAYDMVADGALSQVLASAVLALACGQSDDLVFTRDPGITLERCEAMAAAKTGALLGAACELGARSAGADGATSRLLRQFGQEVGSAYQLADDLLGIYGDPQVTGKPVGADLAARKMSLPVVAALQSGTRAGADLAGLYFADQPMDVDSVTRAAMLVELAGGRDWARAELAARTEAAITSVTTADLDPAGIADLCTLADHLTLRDG